MRRSYAHVYHNGNVYLCLHGYLEVEIFKSKTSFSWDTQDIRFTFSPWSNQKNFIELIPIEPLPEIKLKKIQSERRNADNDTWNRFLLGIYAKNSISYSNYSYIENIDWNIIDFFAF